MFRGRYAAVALVVLLLTGCASQSAPEDANPAVTDATSSASTPSAQAAPAPTSVPTTAPDPVESASEGFLAWVAASRVPDVEASCQALAPELVTRMIAEMRSEGFAEIETCQEMITVAAELYRAVDQDADVRIAVESETATDAVLRVTYLASGECGTVVMQRTGADWIITDQSHEECG